MTNERAHNTIYNGISFLKENIEFLLSGQKKKKKLAYRVEARGRRHLSSTL
jgi:hypothetical protein